MKATVKTLFILFSLFYISYLLLPAPTFPEQLPNSLQSIEPGDSETPLRRAYYTDLTREEVLTHYQNQFSHSTLFSIPLPTYRLNYPPEESYTLIRDQTRSNFLEEIVHPFRESVYINGFEPKEDKDVMFVGNKKWRQKITVKWIPSSLFTRLSVGFLTLICIFVVYKGITYAFTHTISLFINRKK